MAKTREEYWKPIAESRGRYEVSNCGNVRMVNKKTVLKGYKRQGYPCIKFLVDGKVKTANIHRLVAMTFVKNPHSYPHVNHLDGNPENNNSDNLEWCTPSQNSLHRCRVLHKGIAENRPTAVLNWSLVDLIRAQHSAGNAMRKISRDYNICFSTVRDCVRHDTWATDPR